MNYFIRNNERKGTVYHEFYKGKWDEVTFWKDDSLLLHDDLMFKTEGFSEAIIKVIPTYDSCGITEVSVEDWKKIGDEIKHKDECSRELYEELDGWLQEVFMEYDCFTILGL